MMRVVFTKNGYRYTPSKEYFDYINKFKKKRVEEVWDLT